MSDSISRQSAIDAINQICPIDTEYDCTLLDRVDVRCVLTDLPSAQLERWDTCFSCPLSHGCPVIKGCTNDQAEQYAGEIPKDCPLDKKYAQPERPKGKWIVDALANNIYRCSECGIDAPVEPTGGTEYKSNYCPNCGADMRGEQDG